MSNQNLPKNLVESQILKNQRPILSLTIITASCLFFGSMNIAMADACSAKQTGESCKTKTTGSGYEWCDCPPQDEEPKSPENPDNPEIKNIKESLKEAKKMKEMMDKVKKDKELRMKCNALKSDSNPTEQKHAWREVICPEN